MEEERRGTKIRKRKSKERGKEREAKGREKERGKKGRWDEVFFQLAV